MFFFALGIFNEALLSLVFSFFDLLIALRACAFHKDIFVRF